jgi:hypothetical protein
MPFQTCLKILICLILGVSGCMKAVAPPAAPPPQLHLIREGYPPYIWAAFVLTGKY